MKTREIGEENMRKNKYSELILGIIIFSLGLFYFLLTNKIPAKDRIDSRFLPYLLSGFLFVLSAIQISRGWEFIKSGKVKKDKEESDYLTFIKTLSLIILYIGFLNILGFIISTVIFLFLEFIVLTPSRIKKNYILFFFISLVTSFMVYFLFRYGLNLILPRGIVNIGGGNFVGSFDIWCG